MPINFPTRASTPETPKSESKPKQPKYAALSVIFAVGAIALFAGKPSSKELPEDKDKEKENVITVIGCRGCDRREERAFETGDYMFKELGPCAKCSGVSFIKAIYLVPTKKE